MSKAAKISISVIVLLLALFIISIILVTTLVNPNKFKNQISAVVQKTTGREFAISGDVKWSFFPWIGLRMQQMSLANAPGYGQQPFAQAGEADISIKVMPLFTGNVEIDTVNLKDFTLNLTQRAQGQNNWNDLTATKKTTNSSSAKSNSNSLLSNNKKIPNLTISNLDITNATIHYNNEQTGQKLSLQALNLQSKGINFNKNFPLQMKFTVLSNQPALNAQIALQSNVLLNLSQQQYAFDQLALTGNLYGKQYPHGEIPIALRGNIHADLANQTAQAEQITFKIDNMKAQANLSGSKILQAPIFQGNINIPNFNLRALLTDLGQKVSTQDTTAFTKAGLQAQTQFSPKFVKLTNLKANLDDTALTGNFNYANFLTKNFDFDLKLNQLNLTRYSSPQTSANQTTNINRNPASTIASNSKNQTALPVNLLRQLNGQGSLQIGKLILNKLSAENFALQFNANKGLIQINPLNADIYQGKSNGTITLNAQSIPQLTINETLSNVQVGNIFNDMSKTATIQITGTGNLNMNLHTQGLTTNAMINALNGAIKFSIDNGSIKNIDIGQQFYNTVAHFLKGTPATTNATNQTNFSSLTGTVQIVNGIANNNDLLLKSSSLQVAGKGTANLINQTINYNLQATALGSPFGRDIINLQQQIGGNIPMSISGTFANPKINPDYSIIATALLKGQFRQQIEKHFGNNLNKTLKNLKGLQNLLNG